MPSPDSPGWGLWKARGPRRWARPSRDVLKSAPEVPVYLQTDKGREFLGNAFGDVLRAGGHPAFHFRKWWREMLSGGEISKDPPGDRASLFQLPRIPGITWTCCNSSWPLIMPHTTVPCTWVLARLWSRTPRRSGTTCTREDLTDEPSGAGRGGGLTCNQGMRFASARPKVAYPTRAIWAVGAGSCSRWAKGYKLLQWPIVSVTYLARIWRVPSMSRN